MLAALAAAESRSQCATLLATLRGGATDPQSRQWAAEAVASIAGLVTLVDEEQFGLQQAFSEALAEPTSAATLATVDRLAGHLGSGGGPTPATVALAHVARAGQRLAVSWGERLGRTVDAHSVCPPDLSAPFLLAGLLLDVSGRVIRDAVEHAIPNGGGIQVTVERRHDVLSLLVADRANAGVATTSDPGRAERLQGGQARMAVHFGELVVAQAPWGGTTVRLALPAAAGIPGGRPRLWPARRRARPGSTAG